MHGAQVLPQRSPLGAQSGIEHGELETGLGHAVADERLQCRGDVFGCERLAVQQRGNEPAERDIPRALRVLTRIQGCRTGDDLAPSLAVGGQCPRDDHLAHGVGAERGREGRDQGDLQDAQLETLEGHGCRGSGDGHAFRLRPGRSGGVVRWIGRRLGERCSYL